MIFASGQLFQASLLFEGKATTAFENFRLA
jgi:hypothetical protein